MTSLERFVTFMSVVALHVVLLLWVVAGLGQTPPQIVPPTIQGVLVASEGVSPPQELPQAPEPTAPPPAPRPKPKPKPAPKPLPPSERAITVSEPEAEPDPEPVPEPEPEATEIVSAAEERRFANPAQDRTGGQSGNLGAAGPGAAGEPGPVSQPRTDAAHLNNPAPVYPSLSRRLGEQGTVLLDVHIMPDGSVREVRLRSSSGHERLDRSALDAVRRWRYVPARRGETPIAYWYVQPIVFSLATGGR